MKLKGARLVKALFYMDLVKFERHNTHTSVLWEPFNKSAVVGRKEYDGPPDIKTLVHQFNIFVSYAELEARAKCEHLTAFNGFRAWIMLAKGERKPRGWNKTKAKRIEKEFDDIKTTACAT